MDAKGSLTTDRIRDVFSHAGLRCTRQRVALYEALSGRTDHPTADDLYQQLSSNLEGISLATVYNTLEAFCAAGIAQKLACNGGSARFDADTHNHLHLRDEATNTVADVPDDLSRELLNHLPQDALHQLEKKLGFKIHRVNIELVGEKARRHNAP